MRNSGPSDVPPPGERIPSPPPLYNGAVDALRLGDRVAKPHWQDTAAYVVALFRVRSKAGNYVLAP